MKKSILILALLSLAPASLTFANTVQFLGEVSAQTCNININNQQDPVILLPTVPLRELTTNGATTGETQFTINITGCTAFTEPTEKIHVIFQANGFTQNGNLKNTLDPNSRIAIQLLYYDTEITFGSATSAPGQAQVDIPVQQGDVSVVDHMKARYIAEGDGATAGRVQASAQFAITYD